MSARKDWQKFATNIVIILTGAILGWGFAVIKGPGTILVVTAGLALIVFFGSGLYLYTFEYYWRIWYRSSFKNPEIRILNGYVTSQLNEQRCARGYTQFTPEDWRAHFEGRQDDRTYRASTIFADSIDQCRFGVIINPFGEYYPEQNPLDLTTFESIKKFMSGGGIFVHAGGIPFYYSWDSKASRRHPTSKDVQFYSEVFQQPNPPQPTPSVPRIVATSRFMGPATNQGRTPSLVDTLARKNFHLRTTTSTEPYTTTVSQTDIDRRIIGNIATLGETNLIREFRAVTEESPRVIPFLRCRTNWSDQDVFPLCAIRYGRGFLVVAGMDFDINPQNTRLARTELEKVSAAIVRLTSNICSELQM